MLEEEAGMRCVNTQLRSLQGGGGRGRERLGGCVRCWCVCLGGCVSYWVYRV